MSEWISVKDRLPDESEEVLVYGENASDWVYEVAILDGALWLDRGEALEDVSHWMHLPESPIIKPLTKTEALREAITQLERIINSCREGCHHSNILEAAVDGMESLPRLRAALESED